MRSIRISPQLLDILKKFGYSRVRIVRKRKPKPIASRRRTAYLKHREVARDLAHSRVAHFNATYGFTVGRIAIRDQKSRWGSCSRKGNLNFNYRIALLPPHLVDYIVVHELCHLQEFNHAPQFWKLVGHTIPDYLQRRKELHRFKFGAKPS